LTKIKASVAKSPTFAILYNPRHVSGVFYKKKHLRGYEGASFW